MNKKIVVACDSFKESLSSQEVNQIIKDVILELSDYNVVTVEVGDGGEGTIDALSRQIPFLKKEIFASRQDLKQIKTFYYYRGNKAYIESAKIIGLDLIDRNERRPVKYSSYGVGELILDAIKNGLNDITVFLGGSSTNDGGLGVLKALGLKCYDFKDELIDIEIEAIEQVKYLDFSEVLNNLKDVKITVASDVTNPFIGKNGATNIFGKQKGLSDAELVKLEKCLTYLASLYKGLKDISNIEATGAAGGISGALMLVGANVVSGINYFLEEINFDKIIQDADLLITGEGSLDNQSVDGKTISGLLKYANLHRVKVIAVAGKVDKDLSRMYEEGLIAAFSIVNECMNLEKALTEARDNLRFTMQNIVRLFINS